MIIFLDLRAQSVGGDPAHEVTIRDSHGKIFNSTFFADYIRGKDVLLATHGFNVTRQDGIDAFTFWEKWLSLGDSFAYIAVLWPGDSRWIPVIDYPFEGDEAIRSGKLLAQFLNDHLAGAVTISFASHSLGARMVLETVRHLQRPVKRAVLMAGAINNDCLTHEYKDANDKIKTLSILASKCDTVLAFAFPIGNVFEGIVDRSHPYWDGALGRYGPDTPYPANIQAGWQIPKSWNYGHGDYLPDTASTLPAIPIPVNVRPEGTPLPNDSDEWKADWSAAFVSCRIAG